MILVSVEMSTHLVVLLVDNGPLAIDAGRHPILESVHNDFIVGYTFIFSFNVII